jgi:tetratricopeptide (TPR) repeat protein
MANTEGPNSSGQPNPAAIINQLVGSSAPNSLATLQQLQQLSLKAEAARDFDAALQYNEAGGEFIEAAPPTFKAAEITFQLSRGRLLFKSGRYDEAAIALRTALEVSAQTTFLTPDHRNLTCYQACHILAGVRFHQKHFSEARTLLEHAGIYAKERFGETSLEFIDLLLEKTQISSAMNQNIKEVLADGQRCKRAILGANLLSDDQTASLALDLGMIYYEHGVWDEAKVVLQIAAALSDEPIRKTKALLTLGHIAFHQSDTAEVTVYLEDAMKMWMDRAFPPHLERHMVNLQGLVAQAEGDEEGYLHYLQRACEIEPTEQLSFEDQIDLHSRRATYLRLKGFPEEAALEVSQAEALVTREMVAPLQRFKFYLEQSYIHYTDCNYEISLSGIDKAIELAGSSLKSNPILLARAYALRAYNWSAILSEPCTSSSPQLSGAQRNLLKDGEMALKLLSDADSEHSLQKQILNLLIRTCEEQGMKRPLQLLRSRLDQLSFRFPD